MVSATNLRECYPLSDKPTFWHPAEQPHADHPAKLRAPAAERNRDAILDVLRQVLPAEGLVLEIASGSGEHAVHFARAFSALTFQPSDPSREALASIAAWTAETGLKNLRAPLLLDAASETWPELATDAVLCINMVHIAPWSATEGLFRNAGTRLRGNAPLYLYGPFRRPGRLLEESNEAFDRSLRERDPRWGLRDLDDLTALAARNGFGPPDIIEMPANNLSLVFRRG